jgi:hypothetical protein
MRDATQCGVSSRVALVRRAAAGRRRRAGAHEHAVDAITVHVSARTFLPLVYQLASRLSQKQADEPADSDGGRFQRALQKLLLGTASRLPQQSLWTLIALSNGARLPPDQRNKSFHVVDKDKVDAALSVFALLRNVERLRARFCAT